MKSGHETRTVNPAKSILVSLLFAGIVLAATGAAAADLGLARKLIVEGRAADAYALLEKEEFEQAGKPAFDYLLGLAALNSGHADKATLIFERVLAVDPRFAAARMDMGRAYFALGDTERARAEFLRALEQNPPPAALATIRQYLAAMAYSFNVPGMQTSGYFEIGVGRDTNVNNATDQSQIMIPVLVNAVFTLNPANVQTADNTLDMAAGVDASRQIAPNWSLYAGADLRNRTNQSHGNFDFTGLDGRVGLSFAKNKEQFRFGTLLGKFYLDGKTNRDSDGFNGEWRHVYDDGNQSILFGQHVRYRFPDPALMANNFNQSIAGIGWAHAFGDSRTSLFSTIYGGMERDTDQRVDGGKHLEGMRLTGQTALKENIDLYATVGIQQGKYDRINSAFLIYREDRQSDLSIGLVFRRNAMWSLRPQISLIRNQSNIPVNQYKRADLSLALRRDFN